jgi:CHASE3 domain sensor protein
MGLIAALTSLATDNGEGLVGETDDKIITFFSLGVVVFFVLVVIALASLQHFLERRKEQRKAAELRRRVGW